MAAVAAPARIPALRRWKDQEFNAFLETGKADWAALDPALKCPRPEKSLLVVGSS